MSELSVNTEVATVKQSEGSGSLRKLWTRLISRTDKKMPPSVQDPMEVRIAKTESFLSEEKLEPAKTIFFHTTPQKNLDSLVKNGLFSDANDSNLGRILGYSLFFPHEHALGRKGNFDSRNALEETPEDYVLTIWDSNGQLARSGEDGVFQKIEMIIRKKTSKEEVPADFYEASAHKPAAFMDVRRLGPDMLIAAIPLNKAVREEILKSMVLAKEGKISANQIELDLSEKLGSDGLPYLREGTTKEHLVHQLTGAIEKDLSRYGLMPVLEKARKSSRVFKHQYGGGYFGNPIQALWQAMIYRSNINDPINARYLDGAINELTNLITRQGVDATEIKKSLTEDLNRIKKGEKLPLGSYGSQKLVTSSWFYGGNTTASAASALEKKLGIID